MKNRDFRSICDKIRLRDLVAQTHVNHSDLIYEGFIKFVEELSDEDYVYMISPESLSEDRVRDDKFIPWKLEIKFVKADLYHKNQVAQKQIIDVEQAIIKATSQAIKAKSAAIKESVPEEEKVRPVFIDSADEVIRDRLPDHEPKVTKYIEGGVGMITRQHDSRGTKYTEGGVGIIHRANFASVIENEHLKNVNLDEVKTKRQTDLDRVIELTANDRALTAKLTKGANAIREEICSNCNKQIEHIGDKVTDAELLKHNKCEKEETQKNEFSSSDACPEQPFEKLKARGTVGKGFAELAEKRRLVSAAEKIGYEISLIAIGGTISLSKIDDTTSVVIFHDSNHHSMGYYAGIVSTKKFLSHLAYSINEKEPCDCICDADGNHYIDENKLIHVKNGTPEENPINAFEEKEFKSVVSSIYLKETNTVIRLFDNGVSNWINLINDYLGLSKCEPRKLTLAEELRLTLDQNAKRPPGTVAVNFRETFGNLIDNDAVLSEKDILKYKTLFSELNAQYVDKKIEFMIYKKKLENLTDKNGVVTDRYNVLKSEVKGLKQGIKSAYKLMYVKMGKDVADKFVLKDKLEGLFDSMWPSKELVKKYKSRFNLRKDKDDELERNSVNDVHYRLHKEEDVQLAKQDCKLRNPEEEKFITENK